MATRTSSSSPCFLRVAEASAASSASKITSLSTPFSFETASTTIRISLFTASLPPHGGRVLRREPRFFDLVESHTHRLAIHFELHSRVVHRRELPRVALAPFARHLQLDKHARAGKPVEMRAGPQHPVFARRGHFQRVRSRNRILDVEQGGNLAAHALAVVDPNAAFP